YKDLAQPSAKRLGKELVPAAKQLGQTAVRALNTVLAPLRGAIWGWEKIEEIVIPELAKRVEDALHKLVTPKRTVAGPALEASRFAGGEPALREMYVNLLATSMDRDTATKAHPAFAEIIRQLTPDEARVVQFFAAEKVVAQMTFGTLGPGPLVEF